MSITAQKIKRWLLICVGTASLITGLIGIILPVLPTTPFLLLTAICYMHSTPRLYKVLLRRRFIGPYIRNYLEERGMSLTAKVWTLGLLWIALGCSTAFATESLVIRLILLAVLIGVTAHVILIKIVRKKDTVRLSEPDQRKSAYLSFIAEDQEKTD
jgi:uncharacterized protein